MTRRDIFVGLGILGAFVVGAILLVLLVPNFFASENSFPTGTPTVEAKATATVMDMPLVTATAAPTVTVAKSTATVPPTTTPLPATTTATIKPTVVIQQTNATPQINEQPFSLPKGLVPSDGAKSCPQPLPIEKIRSDYLGYWTAFKQAYREGNPEILKPFVDTQARDGKYWQGKQQAIQKTVAGGYYLDYQVEHSDPLVVKINPTFGGPGQCQISVFDNAKLTISAKKKGTDEPFDKDNAKPYVQQSKPGQSFEMVVKNGSWVLAGEGAGTQ
ncbi:MAG TPA: hypothetical protein VH186_15485 [Chloroflexia bacterium]|nr:hypothetical protein [Chloroflexia bacterium]